MSTPQKAVKHPGKTVTVYGIQEGYTSIDYGRNQSKRVKREQESKKTRKQLIQEAVADRRKTAKAKFDKTKPTEMP